MATITTRSLSKDCYRDRMSISVDHLTNDADWDGKTGYYKVVINSIAFSGTGTASDKMFTLDVRAANYNSQNDQVLVDKVEVATNASTYTAGHTTHVAAVVRSNPGPSVFAQGDGTWDLVTVGVDLTPFTDVTAFTLTVDYTLTWHEIDGTDISGLSSSSVNVDVSDDQVADFATISVTKSSGYGVYVLLPTSLATTIDNKDDANDSVPNFSLTTPYTAGSFGSGYSVLNHPISKNSSHTKSYSTKFATVFAVNNGKIDGNGTILELNNSGTDTEYHALGQVAMNRFIEWPSDDTVDATLSYKYGFISA